MQIQAGHSIVFYMFFALCDSVTLTLTFWPKNHIPMFKDFWIIRFWVVLRTDRRANTRTQTDEDERFTPATLVSVSKDRYIVLLR